MIRTQFAASTCLTIAHRLNTILDSDVVIVMDKGGVGEMGPPQALMQQDGGLFSELVKNWEKSA
ncbi:hypothetical protein EON65_18070 [archaeon]|nr:MAG: hypothetical protein EON65_18070 [archaeon]